MLDVNFDFVTEYECKEEEGLLSSGLAMAETARGTHQLDAFMLAKKGIRNTEMYSASSDYTENCVIDELKDRIKFKDFKGFVICKR
jgi:hypothetical protein